MGVSPTPSIECGKSDLASVRGKADDMKEETGISTCRRDRAQAPKQGFTEIKSGRSRRQQGLAACRDSSNEAQAEAEESRMGSAHVDRLLRGHYSPVIALTETSA